MCMYMYMYRLSADLFFSMQIDLHVHVHVCSIIYVHVHVCIACTICAIVSEYLIDIYFFQDIKLRILQVCLKDLVQTIILPHSGYSYNSLAAKDFSVRPSVVQWSSEMRNTLGKAMYMYMCMYMKHAVHITLNVYLTVCNGKHQIIKYTIHFKK